jgi:catechol 2,3-dioxygenase-like lactoylglutathione lyase family enzyme
VLCFDVGDVDATHRALAGQGVVFLTPPTDRPAWMIRTAHFRDPDGNLVEINAPLRT